MLKFIRPICLRYAILVALPRHKEAATLKLPPALSPETLRRVCDPLTFDFDTTSSLPDLQKVLGQPCTVAARLAKDKVILKGGRSRG
jgi:hypothetical protein